MVIKWNFEKLSSRIQKISTRYPDRRHSYTKASESLMEWFVQTGSVFYKKKERAKIFNKEKESIFCWPLLRIHTPEISRQYDISQTSAVKILHKQKIHPYYKQLYTELTNGVYLRRLTFCKIRYDEANFPKNETV